METLKPTNPFRGRAALFAIACLIAPLALGEPGDTASLSETEVARRGAAIEQARTLLIKGDEAYTAARYADAVDSYSEARGLIPDAPISAELRAAATERFAQASVEHARVLSRQGDVPGAKAILDKVLVESVAPENPGALAFRAQLDDPIRTNPALTAEHGKNIDAVRRLLYTAEGAFNLGKYDQATSTYEQVLRIDPTNTAARRGLERVAGAKSNYSQSAYDHARAELLTQVESQWELQPPATVAELALASPGADQFDPNEISVRNKIARIIIPKLALDQTSLDEALEFLRISARDNDTFELDPARKGVNFTVNLGAPDSPEVTKIRTARFDLQLSQVPLSEALRYITDITRTSFTTDDFSVLITPAGSSSAELVTRTYRVPPDFISNMSAGAPAAAATDPFGEVPQGTGLLAKRLGAQEALTSQGVIFPEGASASYIPSANTLRIVNTAANHDYIAQIIETVTRTEPVIVAVRVTMIRVERTRLEELGYDWLLDNFGFGGNTSTTGSSEFNLAGGTTGNGGSLADIPLAPGATARNPITAGNRSGDSAFPSESIDNLITGNRGRQDNNRAPGIFSARGILNETKVQSLIRGLDQKKGVDMMAQPTTVTRSGQASSIAIIKEFIFATEYEAPELPTETEGGSPVSPSTPTALEKKDTGITLEVLPIVDESKQSATVTLNFQYVDFNGFVNYGNPIQTVKFGAFGRQSTTLSENAVLMPVFSRQSLNTTVDVADGATVVVGGLLQDRLENVEDKTPIFGDIPVVGRFFQSKGTKSISTAIIFLVHVEIMDPTGQSYRNR